MKAEFDVLHYFLVTLATLCHWSCDWWSDFLVSIEAQDATCGVQATAAVIRAKETNDKIFCSSFF